MKENIINDNKSSNLEKDFNFINKEESKKNSNKIINKNLYTKNH